MQHVFYIELFIFISFILNFFYILDATKCVDKVYMLRPFVACLPAWFRFAQCLRRYRDTKEAFPHLANAAKYSTTFFVILFSFLHQSYSSKFFLIIYL